MMHEQNENNGLARTDKGGKQKATGATGLGRRRGSGKRKPPAQTQQGCGNALCGTRWTHTRRNTKKNQTAKQKLGQPCGKRWNAYQRIKRVHLDEALKRRTCKTTAVDAMEPKDVRNLPNTGREHCGALQRSRQCQAERPITAYAKRCTERTWTRRRAKEEWQARRHCLTSKSSTSGLGLHRPHTDDVLQTKSVLLSSTTHQLKSG